MSEKGKKHIILEFHVDAVGSQVSITLRRICTTRPQPSIRGFCDKYKAELEKAQREKRKVRTLFDLRAAGLDILKHPMTPAVVDFFGKEIHDLSEEVIERSYVIVIPPLCGPISGYLKLFPTKSHPTHVRSDHPGEVLARQQQQEGKHVGSELPQVESNSNMATEQEPEEEEEETLL